jgi:hypothetical protein
MRSLALGARAWAEAGLGRRADSAAGRIHCVAPTGGSGVAAMEKTVG